MLSWIARLFRKLFRRRLSVINKVELWETSLVSVPPNDDCLWKEV